ncbi:MAG: hypothetical protein QM820_28890 [Minicystis sp.]
MAGEKGALEGRKITANGDHVTVTAAWPYDGLDRACRRLADLVGGGPR